MTNYELMDQAKKIFSNICESEGLNEKEINIFFQPMKNIWGKAGIDKVEGKFIAIDLFQHAKHPEKLYHTIAHELAHHIAGLRNGHNNIFKNVCYRLGIDGYSSHSSNPNAKPIWARV